jgi:hypothetical protein
LFNVFAVYSGYFTAGRRSGFLRFQAQLVINSAHRLRAYLCPSPEALAFGSRFHFIRRRYHCSLAGAISPGLGTALGPGSRRCRRRNASPPAGASFCLTRYRRALANPLPAADHIRPADTIRIALCGAARSSPEGGAFAGTGNDASQQVCRNWRRQASYGESCACVVHKCGPHCDD